jgi:Phage protein.
MSTLNISKKQYEAKIAFAFDRRANEKYAPKDEKKGNTGLEVIYEDLLNYRLRGLSAFWDCALAYLKKGQQPICEDINNGLEAVIEEEGAERLFKEAFKALDESGFFKLQLKEFWKNVNMIDKLAGEGDQKQANLAKEIMAAQRKELLA